MTPQALDRAGIAARVPHQGRMCLLDRLDAWSAEEIACRAHSHRDPCNPLRTASGLLAPCAIEYAAQAMALHGALLAGERGQAPSAGYLASVRAVRLQVVRLDEVDGALLVHARREAGNDRQILYAFTLRDEHGRLLADGRATVVLNTPLPLAGASASEPAEPETRR